MPRDASAFREYASQIPHQHSMYTQFYLKEALKQQRTKELWDEINQLVKEGKEVPEEMERELDTILLKLSKENEDPIPLANAIKSYINIKTDLDALGVKDLHTEERQNLSVSDEDFLRKQRCLAESTLIKTKILAKLHHDLFLSDLEQDYLT